MRVSPGTYIFEVILTPKEAKQDLSRRNHFEKLFPVNFPTVAAGLLDHLLDVRWRVFHPHLLHHLKSASNNRSPKDHPPLTHHRTSPTKTKATQKTQEKGALTKRNRFHDQKERLCDLSSSPFKTNLKKLPASNEPLRDRQQI